MLLAIPSLAYVKYFSGGTRFRRAALIIFYLNLILSSSLAEPSVRNNRDVHWLEHVNYNSSLRKTDTLVSFTIL